MQTGELWQAGAPFDAGLFWVYGSLELELSCGDQADPGVVARALKSLELRGRQLPNPPIGGIFRSTAAEIAEDALQLERSPAGENQSVLHLRPANLRGRFRFVVAAPRLVGHVG